MTMKIPIIDGIPRDPLDTERCDESLSKSESSGSKESLGPGEKRSDVEGDEVGAIENISEDEGAMVGAKVGDDVGSEEESDGAVLGVGPGAVLGLGVGLGVGLSVGLGVGSGVDTEGQENSTS